MPAAWQAGGLHKIILGFDQAFLLLAQYTHGAQGVEVPWLFLQAGLQGCFGVGQVSGVQCLQGLGHTRVTLPTALAVAALCNAFVHQRTHLGVVRVGLQILLEQHDLVTLGRA
ncbi:hypothetical protein D3C80_1749360 [compost metagenome]